MSEGRVKALESSMSLREFLRADPVLSAEQRVLIARQALLMLEQNYVHLPLKSARYAVNPLQRLRLLIARLNRGGALEADWRFHAEMLDIFGSLRDLHTRYVLPQPFAGATAFLPFRIKEYVEDGARHVIVAPLGDGASTGTLPAGVEVTSWNGVPIERAVDLFADRLPGANPAARRARALTNFTVRSLGFARPPDEEFVIVEYLDLDGVPQEARETWQVALPQQQANAGGSQSERAFDLELDVETARMAWLKTVLFAPHVLDLMESGPSEVAVPGGIPVTRELAKAFEARVVPDLTPEIGHIRIRTFTPPEVEDKLDITGFVNEFIRLLGLMPPNGVIVDIRGNAGGSPVAAELCLQALTARRIESEPLQFINSPLNLSICRAAGPDGEDLSLWQPSMEQAIESGAVYSAGVPRTPPALLAEVPQAYLGPVVLLTDARVYSAGDRFAAGFQDHEIGVLLGADATTGAGGGNVWNHAKFTEALSGTADSPYRPLPAGTDISVAIRRTLRVGRNTGAPVEDFGVEPKEIHQTTRDDILHEGVDLMAHAARLLEQTGPSRRFDVELDESANGLTARFAVKDVDRADIYTDGRPRQSVDLADGTASAAVPAAGTPAEVRVEGLAAGRPVATRIFRRDPQGRLIRLSAFTQPAPN
jgi:Peptidase family S41